jgi:nascent polypeptide-associated complex subunit alpha
MMPGMNPKQMQKMMQQMGIKSEEIKASRVIIEGEGERTIIEDPQVTLIEMQGQKSYQITGNSRTESAISDDDVKMVAGQTGAAEADARKALEETGGDIAEAIMKLKK